MKMIPGSTGATIADYGSYTRNCTLRQMPYKIPVNNLQDVQLYIDIGTIKPTTVQYELIHTCGSLGGTIDDLTTDDYIIGQDTNDRWYGVFTNFQGANPVCFVIAITLTIGGVDRIFYSEEYCVANNCGVPLVLIRGCYGNLDNLISYDCEGIYFGVHDGVSDAIGSQTIIYRHQLSLRGVEVTLSAIKNTFKQGRTRNFRTEKEKIYQFWAELVPEWYIDEIDAVFYRGEVFIGDTKYLLNETAFEKVEDCKRMWKPSATFKESCLQSFSCEADPCGPPIEESGTGSGGSGESGEEVSEGNVQNDFILPNDGIINIVSFNGPVQFVSGTDFDLNQGESGTFSITSSDWGTGSMLVDCNGVDSISSQVVVVDSAGTVHLQVWTGTSLYTFPGVVINALPWSARIEAAN